jgi:hypothetical protein
LLPSSPPSDIRRRFRANEKKKELAVKKAVQIAKMAAKAKQTREKKQSDDGQGCFGDHENDGAVDSLSQWFLELALTLQGLGKNMVQELVSKYAPRGVQARTGPYKLVHILHSCREYY